MQRDVARRVSAEPSGHPFPLVALAERPDSWPADVWQLGGTRSEVLRVDVELTAVSAVLRDVPVAALAWRLEEHLELEPRRQGWPKSSCGTAAASAALGASRVLWRFLAQAVAAVPKEAESVL